jgi:hypothetical protein
MRHLSSNAIEKYSLQRLTEGIGARVEEHLLICDGCRESLDEFEAFRQAIKDGSDANSGKATMTAGGG